MSGDEEETLPLRPVRISQVISPVGLDEGSVLAGRYRVIRRLGEGGMGLVVVARDESLDRDVAIKLIRPDRLATGNARASFVAEARAMARVVHPNVVGIHNVGELAKVPYLVMEYVPGTSLSARLAAQDGPLGVGEAMCILDQVGRGIAAIHASGIVHRDLKPANVLIGPGFRVAVGDLGISQLVTAPKVDADSWGTPSYMAPEERFDMPQEPELARRSDVFSFAVVAYRVLTGQLPYRRARVPGVGPPKPASALNPCLPRSVDDVLERALALVPERRTHSADTFRRSLLEALEGGVHRERPPARVLIADDDESYRLLTKMMLSRAFPDARFECAEDGAAALTAAKREWPDLVVSDLDMPELGGAALIRELRSLPQGRALPIIVASAVAGATDWRLLSDLDADGFLGKPFDPSQITALARGVLEAAERRSP